MKRSKQNQDEILNRVAGIRHELYILDINCHYWSSVVEKNEIGFLFDDDPDGNGNEPFLFVEFTKNHARFKSGRDLTKAEKQNKIKYKNFDSDKDFAKHLIRLVNEYFDDWVLVRKSSLVAK